MRKIIVNRIPRYESLFFNCYNARSISYFKHLKLPVELLFYKSFENVNQAMQQCVSMKKTRWNYEASSVITLDDLQRLGIHVHARSYVTTEETIDHIKQGIDADTLILLFTKISHLEHRKNAIEGDHAVFVTGYDSEPSNQHFILLDDNEVGLGDYNPYVFSMETLSLSLGGTNRFFYFTFDPFDEDAAQKQMEERSFALVTKLQNDVDLLRTILRQIDYSSKNEHEHIGRIIEALIVLSGSRSLYAHYIEYCNIWGDDLHRHLDQSSKLYQIIRNTLYKYLITDTIDLNKLENQLDILESNEDKIITSLKSGISNPVYIHDIGGPEWIKTKG